MDKNSWPVPMVTIVRLIVINSVEIYISLSNIRWNLEFCIHVTSLGKEDVSLNTPPPKKKKSCNYFFAFTLILIKKV